MILKTIDLIFGMPYLNQYDAAATDLSDRFTAVPDFTPYEAIPSDTRIFDPAKVREGGLLHIADLPPSAPLDDPSTIQKVMNDSKEQQVCRF